MAVRWAAPRASIAGQCGRNLSSSFPWEPHETIPPPVPLPIAQWQKAPFEQRHGKQTANRSIPRPPFEPQRDMSETRLSPAPVRTVTTSETDSFFHTPADSQYSCSSSQHIELTDRLAADSTLHPPAITGVTLNIWHVNMEAFEGIPSTTNNGMTDWYTSCFTYLIATRHTQARTPTPHARMHAPTHKRTNTHTRTHTCLCDAHCRKCRPLPSGRRHEVSRQRHSADRHRVVFGGGHARCSRRVPGG